MSQSTYQSRAIARRLRDQLTPVELRLWSRLRAHQLGVRFRTQVARGDYILDFFCARLRLAIEIDGPCHHGREDYDERRTRRLTEAGLVHRMLRFSNEQIRYNIDDVLLSIRKTITELS